MFHSVRRWSDVPKIRAGGVLSDDLAVFGRNGFSGQLGWDGSRGGQLGLNVVWASGPPRIFHHLELIMPGRAQPGPSEACPQRPRFF